MKELFQTRKNISGIIRREGIEAMNKIPEGFKNNLIWNFGHVIVSQQLLCYRRSGLPLQIDDQLVNQFKNGTKPERWYDQSDLDHLIEVSKETLSIFQEDLNKGIFKSYDKLSTRFGLEITNIEEALRFNIIHEAMHFGQIMAITKIL